MPAIQNTITFTLPAGPSPTGPRYEHTAVLVRSKRLTTRGAERILNRKYGKTGERYPGNRVRVIALATSLVEA